MRNAFEERVRFWDISYPNHSKNDILKFERDRNLSIPKEYFRLLMDYGKLKFVKTWFLYYELSDGSDHVVSDSFSIEDQHMIWKNYWAEVEKSNPNLEASNYLPIFGTHSSNFLFLIGIGDKNTGRIYEYDLDYEDFEPVRIAQSFEDFFMNKIYSQYDINEKSMIGSIDLFKKDGIEVWDIERANFTIRENQATVDIESNGKLLSRTEYTNEALKPSFRAELKLNSSMNLMNPTELLEEDCVEPRFEYFENEIPLNLKFGIVKGFQEVYYMKIEGEIRNGYEWESGCTKFRITLKRSNLASS